MGQKTHPKGYRLAVTKDWRSVWYADGDYKDLLEADEKIRKYLRDNVGSAGIDAIKISRSINDVEIDLRVARPGLVIGRGGSTIEAVKKDLDKLIGGKVRLNVQEVSHPDLSAELLAESISGAITRRYPYKRAVRSALKRAMDAGAEGIKIFISGRLGGHTIARREKYIEGSVPTSTLSKNVKFASQKAVTKYGTLGVKVWVTVPDEE
ncbi:30S ribosomal protein S3 [candidate division WWE3 bacterium]|uniref:Small ribosomal subunit protein uS3 n=1 Tax=candidate division WWE3 bacterium TaxID=2053526 RepID=A0A955RS48_UNCKA|nr:30S ribosomal protein S3 [candidate division WWE3 bacterium]